MPGPEVLGGELTARYLADVVVDVRRRDIMPASPGAVGQQLAPAAAPPLEAADDGAGLVLGDGLLPVLGALGRVVEYQLALGQVTCSFMIVASPNVPFSSAYSSPPGRKNPTGLSRTAAASTLSRVRPRPSRCRLTTSRTRQRCPKLQYPVVLGLVSLLPPLVVVPVLTAPCRVCPDSLEVTAGVRADPDLLPGGRDHQRPDPGQGLRIGDRRIGAEIAEAAPAAPAPDPVVTRAAAPEPPPAVRFPASRGIRPARPAISRNRHRPPSCSARAIPPGPSCFPGFRR
jgi:hypothetical protein